LNFYDINWADKVYQNRQKNFKCSLLLVEAAIERVRSGRVGLGQFDSVRLSDHGAGLIRLGWVSGLLVSGRFGFWVVSGRVRSVIGSSSVGLFQILGRIRSGQLSSYFGFRVVSGWVGSVIESSSVGLFRVVLSQVGLVIRSSNVGSF
jgi:hypothetical protein